MMRRSAGFHADETRRQLLKEWQNVPALELTANDYITCRVNSVDLKNRLSDIETNCRDRLHVWLLRIVGASTAPTSMALPCRWRSRPQHQKRTNAPQQETTSGKAITRQRSISRSHQSRDRAVPSPWRGTRSVRRCCKCRGAPSRSPAPLPRLPHRRAAPAPLPCWFRFRGRRDAHSGGPLRRLAERKSLAVPTLRRLPR